MKLADHYIIGAMAPPRGKGAFDRANVIISANAEQGPFLNVRAYIGADEVEGKPLTREEWDALLRSEQAIEITPVPSAKGAALWILRPSFMGRDAALEELRSSGSLLHDKISGSDGSFLCLVNEPEANHFRDGWAARAAADAQSWARSGLWDRALEAAARAFSVERGMHPERLALLSLVYERTGNKTRADAYVDMAERSRGKDFAAQVRERRDAFRRELVEAPDATPESGVRPKYASAMEKASAKSLKAGLGRLKRSA